MILRIDPDLILTEIRPHDRDAYLVYLNDEEVSRHLLSVSYPYSVQDADQWMETARGLSESREAVLWAIRRHSDEQLIGGCGLHDLRGGSSHRAELGYWIARPFWGQGIMTRVVAAACRYAFEQCELEKLVAYVFAGNPASSRVLEKNGFEQEGMLRRHFRKNGRLLDAQLFGRIRE